MMITRNSLLDNDLCIECGTFDGEFHYEDGLLCIKCWNKNTFTITNSE
jgi:hypothetical protein